MIDLSLPLELDDGTPVEIDSEAMERVGKDYYSVRLKWFGHAPERKELEFEEYQAWWYRTDDGSFDGGNKRDYFYARNVENVGPSLCEDWS